MSELFLHIGSYKTGTTSIQNALHKNQEANIEKYYYPSDTKFLKSKKSWLLFLPYLKKSWKHKIRSLENTQDAIKESSKIIHKIKYSIKKNIKVIISEEDISQLDPETLLSFSNEISKFCKIKIIYYVRSTDTIIASMYSQTAKTYLNSQRNKGRIKTLDNINLNIYEKYNEFKGIQYKRILQKFINIFGKENIVVFDFNQIIQNRIDITQHFFEYLKINRDPKEKYHRNESLSFESVVFCEQLWKKTFLKEDFPPNFFNEISQINGEKFALTNQVLDHYWEKNKEDNIFLDEKFGIRFTRKRNSDSRDEYISLKHKLIQSVISMLVNSFTNKLNIKELNVSFLKELNKNKNQNRLFGIESSNYAETINLLNPKNFMALSHLFYISKHNENYSMAKEFGIKLLNDPEINDQQNVKIKKNINDYLFKNELVSKEKH